LAFGKKINMLFKFSNVNKLAGLGRSEVGRAADGADGVGRPADESTAQPGYGLSHNQIHYADKARDGARSAIGMGHSSRNRV